MLHKAAQSNQRQQSADAFRGPATQAAALAQTASLTLPNGEPPSSSRLGRSRRTDELRVCIMAQQTKCWAFAGACKEMEEIVMALTQAQGVQ